VPSTTAHADNNRVVAFLKDLPPNHQPCPETITSPDNIGSVDMHVHPEILQRLWTDITASLGTECRGVLCGRPVLFDPATRRVFAFGFGTMYVVCVPPPLRPAPPDHKTVTRLANKSVIDLEYAMGIGWVFGNWSPSEIEWSRHFIQPHTTSMQSP